MVEALLAHEANVCAAARAYAHKVEEVVAEKRAEWDNLSVAELRDLCASKELPAAGTKDVCRDRLAEAFKTGSEVDKVLAVKARAARMAELSAQGKPEVLKLCQALDINPLVKPVVVERLLAHEAEHGCIQEPNSKKARKGNK